MDTGKLGIRRVEDVPLGEISGLGQRRAADGSVEVLAVGDEEFAVVVGSLELPDRDYDFRRVDVKDAIQEGDPAEGSEWEAADGDGTGRVFVLQESPGKVFVLDDSLTDLVAAIDLELDLDERPDLDWASLPNSQGEGLVLLRNGHLLVAKEKDPPLLMEFGPEDGGAAGVAPQLLFSTSAKFPLPPARTANFGLKTVWELDGTASGEIDDISDVAVGPDDRLYLLSDESRCIARLEPRLSPRRNHLGLSALWRLPEKVVQPEGLVIIEDPLAGGAPFPIVAIDRDERRENFFVLSHLDA